VVLSTILLYAWLACSNSSKVVMNGSAGGISLQNGANRDREPKRDRSNLEASGREISVSARDSKKSGVTGVQECRSSEEAIGDRSKIVMQELRSQELQKLQEFRRKAANRPRTQKEWYSLAKAIEYV
jgi:hypothetical protein